MTRVATSDRQIDRLVYSIRASQSDIILRAWGFDLRREYLEILQQAAISPRRPVLELATGSGRMASVLARLGHIVLSGDLDHEKLPDARARIGTDLQRVAFIRLDVEVLPFHSGSIDTIVCMNTLHELDRPEAGLEEILRVHSGEGPLIIGDFNEEGFDAMQRLHRLVYRNDHPRGSMPIVAARARLGDRYIQLTEISTTLNLTLVATGRKTPREPRG